MNERIEHSCSTPGDRPHVCVACLQPVSCDVFFASDHVCEACADKAAERDPRAITDGSFFPDQLDAVPMELR